MKDALEVFKRYLKEHTPLTEEQFEQLQQEVMVRNYTKGKVLLTPGEQTHDSYFVCQGLLKAYRRDEEGKESIIQFAPENWWITDRSSVYFDEPASLYIEVVEDVALVRVSRFFIERAQAICPAFVTFNVTLLHNTIRHMQNRICLLLGASAEERYLDFIHLYPNVSLRVPQLMIASYLGITPESLSRVKKELAKRYK